jgi:hypothetical protein
LNGSVCSWVSAQMSEPSYPLFCMLVTLLSICFPTLIKGPNAINQEGMVYCLLLSLT